MKIKRIDIKKIKKILERTFLGFLLVVLLFVLIPLLPIQNNYFLKMVTSGSMRPTIKTGAIVMVRPISSYKIRDIITFKVGQGERDIVTHRIVGRQGDEFITQGDANDVADDRNVTKDQIKGKVVFHIPWAGYFADFAQRPAGFALLVLLPAGVVIADEIKKIYREISKP